MRDSPLVTVCVPVYNGERFLKEALDSILSQSYRNFELYIFDNCSTDRTQAIYSAYKDPRIRVVRHKQNIGSLANWNACIAAGKGRYIAIYHADDVYMPRILEEELLILERYPEVSCVFTSANKIDGEGKSLGAAVLPPQLVNRPLGYQDALAFMLKTFRSPYISPTCIARRSAYRKAGRYPAGKFTQAGDVDMYLRLTRVGFAYLLDKRLIRYRHTDGQASIRYSTTYVKPNQLFGVLDQHIRSSKNAIAPPLLRTYEAYRDWDYTVCAINILAKKVVRPAEARTARRYLRRSLTLRRVCRAHKELMLLSITAGMLVAAHTGFGRIVARTINAQRWKRHLAKN
jgi:glycosyltransferase involved in cell wall biosynthesis